MSRQTIPPPTLVVINWSGQEHATTRRGFKKPPRESLWTQTRLSRPYTQKLSPLSTVTNADEFDTDGETFPVWTSNEPPRPLSVKWRKVCATGVFPVLSEAPRRWDGSRQTMKEFIASIISTTPEYICADFSDDSTATHEADTGEYGCDNAWTESSQAQPKDTAKTSVFDTSGWDEFMTAPLLGKYSYTNYASSHHNEIAKESAPPAAKKIEFQPTCQARPTQSSMPDIWPTHTRNMGCREMEHEFRVSQTRCI
ncbi:hypothetical protein QBC37DRAFT_458661 [Rhypophila decipiens]|uniref:Uncharacterized protein n=1 Tax=Rhypophila decipiens TaxID=261697 RepID=A0AAN6YCF4_9PEZI|nr:hypothetical protein QBC37DRAFT_458661 [Rhypophila decipiens]